MPALAAPPQLPPPSRTPQLGCEPWVEGGLTPEQLAAGTDKRGEICHLCAEAPQKTSAPGGGKTGRGDLGRFRRYVPCCLDHVLPKLLFCNLSISPDKYCSEMERAEGHKPKSQRKSRRVWEGGNVYVWRYGQVTGNSIWPCRSAKSDPTAITPIRHLQVSFLFGPQRSDKDGIEINSN